MTRTVLPAAMSVALLCSGLPAAEKAADPPKRPDPKKALQQKVQSFRVNAALKETLERYAKLAAVEIEVDWEALRETGVTEKTNVRLTLQDVTVEQLLDLTLAQVARERRPLAWYIDDDVVRVTTQLRVLHGRELPSPVRGPQGTGPRRAAATFDFDAIPIEKVIAFLREISGANIHVNWTSLEQVGIGRDTPITLNLRNISIERVLDVVVDTLSGGRSRLESVYWIVDRGVVTIATGAALNNQLRVRVYDISDLLMVVPTIQRPALTSAAGSTASGDRESGSQGRDLTGLFTSEGTRMTTGGESAAEQRRRTEETLIEIIKGTIGEDMWQPMGKGSIKILGGQLIVSQTPLGFKLMAKAVRRR